MQLCTSLRSTSSLEVASIFEITRPPRPMDCSSVRAGEPETAAGRVAQVIVSGTTRNSQCRSAPSMTNIWSKSICEASMLTTAPFQPEKVPERVPPWGAEPSLEKISRRPSLVRVRRFL